MGRLAARPAPRSAVAIRATMFSYFSTELSFNASLLGPGAPTQEGVLKAQISQPRLASERVCARAHDSAADPHVRCVSDLRAHGVPSNNSALSELDAQARVDLARAV